MIVAIQNVDDKLLSLIQRRLRCSFLDRAMPIITSLGTCGVLWGVIMLVFLRMLRFRRIGLILFITLVFCAVITNVVLKPLVARPRPCHIFTEMRLLVTRPMDYSFPSGHTMSSFAAATVIIHANQTLGIVAFVLALLISFSRLYLFVHYPSDVFVGMVFGVTIAYVMLMIFHY